MRKIAFIGHAPGTANALLPLIENLKNEYDVKVFPFHQSSSEIWKVEQVSENEFEEIFKEKWDLIVTGTGSLHRIEREVPLLARKKGIPTLSVLDSWNNYENRYRNKPDYIVCLDENVKEEIMKLGFDNNQVFALGNPHFDRLKDFKSDKKLTKPYSIVFYSTMHQDTNNALKVLGDIKKKQPELIKEILATPHPRETNIDMEKVCLENRISFKHYTYSYPLMKETDISIGFGSTIQYEAMMVGKPTIVINNLENIEEQISNVDIDKKIIIDFQATKRCADFIKKLLKEKNNESK